MCKLDYLYQKLKFSSIYSIVEEFCTMNTNHTLVEKTNIHSYFQNNDRANACHINRKFLFNNLKLLKNIFSNSFSNLNFKAIPINQWIFWQCTNFNHWLSVEEEIEYMRSMIYDIYLTENYSSKEIFDLAKYLFIELIKIELQFEDVSYHQTIIENFSINNESSFSKLLLNLINELISEAWYQQTSKSDINIKDFIFNLDWFNSSLANLLKYNKLSVNVNILLIILNLLFIFINIICNVIIIDYLLIF